MLMIFFQGEYSCCWCCCYQVTATTGVVVDGVVNVITRFVQTFYVIGQLQSTCVVVACGRVVVYWYTIAA